MRSKADALEGTVDIHTGDGHIAIDGLKGDVLLYTGDGAGSTSAFPRASRRIWMLSRATAESRWTIPLTIAGRIAHSKVRDQLNGGGSVLILHSGDGPIRIERY